MINWAKVYDVMTLWLNFYASAFCFAAAWFLFSDDVIVGGLWCLFLSAMNGAVFARGKGYI